MTETTSTPERIFCNHAASELYTEGLYYVIRDEAQFITTNEDQYFLDLASFFRALAVRYAPEVTSFKQQAVKEALIAQGLLEAPTSSDQTVLKIIGPALLQELSINLLQT